MKENDIVLTDFNEKEILEEIEEIKKNDATTENSNAKLLSCCYRRSFSYL